MYITGSVERCIGRYIARYVGRESVDTRLRLYAKITRQWKSTLTSKEDIKQLCSSYVTFIHSSYVTFEEKAFTYEEVLMWPCVRGTQRQYSSKPLKHSIVKRILVFKW